MRIAVLDIGTNTVLLLIAEVDDGRLPLKRSRLRVIRDDHAVARLGQGVDQSRKISEEAYQRFLGVLRKHIETIQSHPVDQIIAVATSAMRDAENRDEIIQRTKDDTGIEIELLSGEDESRWTYIGALLEVTGDKSPLPEKEKGRIIAVVDIGGGSTEISMGDGQHFDSGISIDIGALRITERFFSTNPITKEAIEDARAFIRESLLSKLSRPTHITELVTVAGTPTTLAAMDQNLPKFEVEKVHNYKLRREAVDRLLDIMLKVDAKTLLDHFPSVNKARADILPAGTLILAEVMDYLGVKTARVSTQGLRYGIAMRELSGP
jgi:exopolyphosphatase/guanosine-5'-triphosphate,3'-diphosphate pyrophosphatase